jgi:hypothetical protein
MNKMRYDGHKLEKDNSKFAPAIEERITYGVSTVDTWGFDSYLLAVFANGLQKLADDLHGWPAGEEWPTFEGWREAVQQAADDAYWCLVTFEDLEHAAYEEAYPHVPEDFANVEDFLAAKATPEASVKWNTERVKLCAEREMRKDRMLDFIKKNFWALWD